jgi:lipid-A-disaccharide synthase
MSQSSADMPLSAPRIFIIAGEASGDLLGGDLLREIKQTYPDAIIGGIGGDQMLESGLPETLFPITDLSVMGLVEVIRHLPRLLKRMAQTKYAIQAFKPDMLITIDAPDFTLRIAKWVKQYMPQVKIVHTVAPTVWAWRPKRAQKIARFLDGLLCLFPFEPRYFTPHGLRAHFMGHPLAKMVKPLDDEKRSAFFARYQLDEERPILMLLPGSRQREIETLLPVFIDTAHRLLRAYPDLQIIVPTLPHTEQDVGNVCALNSLPVTLITQLDDKYTAMQLSQVALHASGTVALELAFCDTPMVTGYLASPLTAWFARRLLTIKYVNLVNLLEDEAVVPEMLQDDCAVDKLAPMVEALLTNQVSAARQRTHFAHVRKTLQPDKPAVEFLSEILKS